MTGDVSINTLLNKARSLLCRLERQEARFLHGRNRGSRGHGRGPGRGRGRKYANLATRARKKEASGPQRRVTRPSWPCAPQCTRKVVPCRSDHSKRSLNVSLANRRSFTCASSVPASLDVESKPPSRRHQRRMATPKVGSRNPSSTRILEAASNVSVNTFVAIQVRHIMEKAASNMAHIMRDGERSAGDTAESARLKALRQQVMRVATYTAVCRRLEHALNLYGEAAPYRSQRHYRLANHSNLPGDNTSNISALPKSVLLTIFGFLNQRDLSLSVAPVCRRWRKLSHHQTLWRHLLLDWSSDEDAGLSRIPATCALLSSIPGLLTLEMVGCAHVDQLLSQVVKSCRQLRTLAVDSCTVSHRFQSMDDTKCILTDVLTACKKLHSLIVAFTPNLTRPEFFTLLGKRCWTMRCFLVSADVVDTREFFESASYHAPGSKSREAVGGARAAILSNRVTDIQTEDSASLPTSPATALLQWRLHPDHANATYFGMNVRMGLAETEQDTE